jgi:hypothetical protein
MTDDEGFDPTERRSEPDEITPAAPRRTPDDDQADTGDYVEPDADPQRP